MFGWGLHSGQQEQTLVCGVLDWQHCCHLPTGLLNTFNFSLFTSNFSPFHYFTISLPSPANKIFNFHCLFLLQFGKLVNGNKCWPFSFIVLFLLSTDALVFGSGSGRCNDARYPNKSWGYPRKFHLRKDKLHSSSSLAGHVHYCKPILGTLPP